MTSEKDLAIILSCEHATNAVPDQYLPFLTDRIDQLDTHRGYDPGAHDFARLLAASLSAPLFAGDVSRLLVELNRSLANHRSPPVPPLSGLTPAVKEEILARYYHPYRRQVEEAVTEGLRQGKTVLHLSIHSFTPVLDGITRTADIGFLYDPGRAGEREFCRKWRAALTAGDAGWRLRNNYPYRGTSDAFVTALRKKFPARDYLGIELEINQMYPLEREEEWRRLQDQLLASIIEVLRYPVP
jgi:predicted N-formylglutamate amidohydrolase